MYLQDQAPTYPYGVHISRDIDIKLVADRVCLHLPIWDVAKKKGFKVYYNEEIPTRKMKVEIVNFPRSWSSLFNGKQLIRTPNAHDARTFWS